MTRADKNASGTARRKGNIILKILLPVLVAAALLFAWNCYVNDYYHAVNTAQAALKGSGTVSVREDKDYIYFEPADFGEKEPAESAAGIIFYPGGKVEETAYAPLMTMFAECGYPVYLLRMPARLAMLDMDAAADVITKDTGIDRWILMGHSLGGVAAANYVAKHGDEVSALVLLAAYSTKKLGEDLPVISIYGSEDGVLNLEQYEKSKDNLPKTAHEYVIDGGCHAGFGDYGPQKGDGEPEISNQEQQQAVVDIVRYYLEEYHE